MGLRFLKSLIILNTHNLSQRSNKMTDKEIIELYDSNLNLTLKELSQITGLSISILKQILMK